MIKIYDYLVSLICNRLKITRKPRLINFPITDNCSSKCIMCNVWEDKVKNEITPLEIQTILNDKLFNKVKHLGISGGEPSLRQDLIECVRAILESLESLKSISITSHGFHPRKWEKMLPEIKDLCQGKKVDFSFNISVDGVAEGHEEIRRIKGGWKKLNETILIAKDLNIPIQLQTTVSNKNIFFVNEIQWFANKLDVEVIFRKAIEINRLYNNNLITSFEINPFEASFLADFLGSSLVTKSIKRLSRALYYKNISTYLIKGGERKMPCSFQNEGMLIDSFGKFYPCSIAKDKLIDTQENLTKNYFGKRAEKTRKSLREKVCPNCQHDQSGPWSPYEIIAVKINSIEFFRKLNILRKFSNKFISAKVKGFEKDNILLIGAYGGEHVGDSAILGGVIKRTLERRKVNKAYVLSSRADRTKFWISQLQTELKNLEVIDINELKTISIEEIVYAGGPIMDDPLNLITFKRLVKFSQTKGINFHIEGVGYGPFKTAFTERLALQLINYANGIILRDNFEKLRDIDSIIDKDPAFDYIESRKHNLNPASIRLKRLLKKKLDFETNIQLIGLNLRPIWKKFIGAENSNKNISSIYFDLIDGIIENLNQDQRLVYIPFNTDHYGFSDLDVIYQYIYEYKNGVKPEKLIIIEEEFGTEDMLNLIDYLNKIIAMRFHACIFGAGLGKKVYGIDYDLTNNKGKVQGLFDAGHITDCTNILDINRTSLNNFINGN